MKFIHLSNIKIGSPVDCGTSWAEDRISERYATLDRILGFVKEQQADLMIIAGGLFHEQPVTSALEELAERFHAIPETEVVIIAGESDRLRLSSPVRSFNWPSNVHYVLSEGPECLPLRDGKTVVYASSLCGDNPASAERFAENLKGMMGEEESSDAEADQRIRVAVLCADADEAKAKLSESAFSYVAISGGPKCREIVPGKIYQSGGAESEGMGDSGAHGIYCGMIGEDGSLGEVRFVSMASASYIPLVVSATTETTNAELLRLLRGEMEKRGTENIYRIRITGSRDPEVNYALSELKARFRIAEILDETEPEYDFAALFAEHPQDIIGGYIGRLMRSDKEMNETEKRAMFYGIDALLRTVTK